MPNDLLDRAAPHFEDALECVVAGMPAALPLRAAGLVVEYDVSPLPLAAEGVLGVGVYAGHVLLSLGVDQLQTTERRRVMGLLLDLDGKGDHRWALEVDLVRGFVRATATLDKERWLSTATTSDGRQIRWLDVVRLVNSFRSAAP